MSFKVLLVYPNYMMVNLLPTNIGVLTACLKQHGYDVDLFDTTFYRTAEKSLDEIRVENLQLRKFSLEDVGIKYKTTTAEEDLVKKIREYKPDLIGVTTVEDTWPQALRLIDAIPEADLKPIIVGGVFPTFAPEAVINEPRVNYVCVGEGEEAIVEVCRALEKGDQPHSVKNIWCKMEDGTIKKNPMRHPIPMDEVPFGDFDLFEKERFYRPMQGKIFKMLPIETDRGCPYTCRFCEAPALNNLYRTEMAARYFRRRSWKKVHEEISLYVKKYGMQYSYFNAETFLAMSEREFQEFTEVYSDFKFPFWCQTRIETINLQRLQAMEAVNCNRISVGLEHGNEEFRRKVIGKGFTNQMMIKAFETFSKTSIPITINNILGFPGETRDMTFDTIELNRYLDTDSVNAYYFMPYRGTPFYKECLDAGYITADTRTRSLAQGSCLNMPHYSADEIQGLVRTFSLYVKFPKFDWPKIKRAEKFDAEGNRIFRELADKYYEACFDDDFKTYRKACFNSSVYNYSMPAYLVS
jgi:anaerobic magnesium-protoporphyrin IX monomethyl ester cyclase